MKTKNIFKALALAMLMPAMLLTTACSNDDDVVVNNETTNKKGYPLQVTVNVTREGDAATRASYNESTRKLEFSAGDKLFVGGNYDGWSKRFAGTLDYDTESGKFSGTIYTQDDTYSTYEDLFGNSDYTIATLLPAGYNDHGYLVINTNDPDVQYDDFVEESDEYTLATSKADGVAQFSYEKSSYYDDGFALSPDNAILNFTITGLAASTSVNVSLNSTAYNITGTVTTNASGTATFAAGIMGGLNLQPFSLTVAGNPITLVSSDKVVDEGKIYNITRNAIPGALIGQFSVSDTKKVYFSKGNLQATYYGSSWTWAFAENQWDYIGNAEGNTKVSDSTPFVSGYSGSSTTVDLFGWVGASSTWTGVNKYGITSSSNTNGYGNVADETLKSDWGTRIGSGWRTLSMAEWTHLFNERSASTVGGTADGRYAKAKINNKTGMILFPDTYTHPAGVTAPTNVNTANASFDSNTYTVADWTKMESAGCVFLPAAGWRNGTTINNPNDRGFYWSTTPSNATAAKRLFFSAGLDLTGDNSRAFGFSVRLVREVE